MPDLRGFRYESDLDVYKRQVYKANNIDKLKYFCYPNRINESL